MPRANQEIPFLSSRAPAPRAVTEATDAVLILAVWVAVFFVALARPAVLDDADATHAQAAQYMLSSHDFVTLHVDGVRYLEKAPLPYWITALSLRIFGANAFAVHLPLALTVLALAVLAYRWSRRAFGRRAGLYASLFTLTAAGVFLFTRVFIPDALLSLLVLFSLYGFLSAMEPGAYRPRSWAYAAWLALALAVLTKGLVAMVFVFGAGIVFLLWTKDLRHLYRLRLFSGFLLMLLAAAPWHVLAEQRNHGSSTGRDFYWFYFVNEHFLRFLGRRTPDDYNKLPALLYWLLHLVWLFPWSVFLPAAIVYVWRRRREHTAARDLSAQGERLSRFELLARREAERAEGFGPRSAALLAILAALVLLFFAFSTNQEYYTFPAWTPLLMLIAAAVASIEHEPIASASRRAMSAGFAALTLVGLTAAAALAYGLWSSRALPYTADIGSVLAHRGVANYTLAMSHFFDLTGPSFAALRRPSALAAAALALGPVAAWTLYTRRRFLASMLSLTVATTVLLVAAHLAFVRFEPMLSSQAFAGQVLTLQRTHRIAPGTQVLLYGDQALGSSIPFYLHQQVTLVDGRSTSMLFGSTFPDAPPVFITHDQLAASWAKLPRKLLFVPLEHRAEATQFLGPHAILLYESSGKALYTNQPLPISVPHTHNSKLKTQN